MIVYSIGHSNLSWEDFLSLLRANGIEKLVDVRSYPGSRYVPHFNKEFMEDGLRKEEIYYHHLRSLGGRRRPELSVDEALVEGWDKESFKNYAAYSLGTDYHKGLKELIGIARESRTVMMCAEALPWRCHRLIISNSLVDWGHEVLHILGKDQLVKHSLGLYGAKPLKRAGQLIYPKVEE